MHQPIVPQYMASAGSIMSTKVAEAVVVAHHTVGLRMLPDDSEAVGLWLAAFDIHYLNESEAGCSVRPFPPIQVCSSDIALQRSCEIRKGCGWPQQISKTCVKGMRVAACAHLCQHRCHACYTLRRACLQCPASAAMCSSSCIVSYPDGMRRQIIA